MRRGIGGCGPVLRANRGNVVMIGISACCRSSRFAGDGVVARRAPAVARAAAVLVVSGLLMTACSGSSHHSASARSGASSAAAAAPASSGSAGSSSAAPTLGPAGPSASGASAGGSSRHKRVLTAPPAPFSSEARYPDGIGLRILGVTQQTITATGPGAMTGKPKTTFDIEFANHSRSAVNLNEVVVEVTYGSPSHSAAPVYDPTVQDFAGTVAAGKTVRTEYAFSIPTADLNHVRMTVRFNQLHAAATFVGAVTVK